MQSFEGLYIDPVRVYAPVAEMTTDRDLRHRDLVDVFGDDIMVRFSDRKMNEESVSSLFVRYPDAVAVVRADPKYGLQPGWLIKRYANRVRTDGTVAKVSSWLVTAANDGDVNIQVADAEKLQFRPGDLVRIYDGSTEHKALVRRVTGSSITLFDHSAIPAGVSFAVSTSVEVAEWFRVEGVYTVLDAISTLAVTHAEVSE